MIFPILTMEKNSLTRLTSTLLIWMYLASTLFSNISTAPQPLSASNISQIGSMHIWKIKQLLTTARKPSGNSPPIWNIANKSAYSDYSIKENLPIPPKSKNGQPVRVIIENVINFLCISLAILGIISANIAGGVFVSFVLFSTIFSKGITKLQTTYGEKLQILSTYADQILLTEQKEMHSHILQELKADLTSQNQTASQAVRQLSKLMNALDQRSNLEVERDSCIRPTPMDRNNRRNRCLLFPGNIRI